MNPDVVQYVSSSLTEIDQIEWRFAALAPRVPKKVLGKDVLHRLSEVRLQWDADPTVVYPLKKGTTDVRHGWQEDSGLVMVSFVTFVVVVGYT
jgi:hypothetical protein